MTIRAAVLCDEAGCDAVFATAERLPHHELIREAHADGWTSTNKSGQWTNECPEHNE